MRETLHVGQFYFLIIQHQCIWRQFICTRNRPVFPCLHTPVAEQAQALMHSEMDK